jgi:hypothetical protein
MIARFFDRQDPLNGSIVRDESHWSEMLNELQGRKPFFCELLGENGYKILVGIGKPSSCVQYSSVDGSPPYLMAVGPVPESSTGHFEFLMTNTLTPVPSRYCVPSETMKEIVAYFLRTGERCPAVSWEEI